MRQVGTLPDEEKANLFTDYLVSEGIAAHAELEDGSWAIWVRDENQIQQASDSLQEFTESPNDARYRDVSARASEVRRQEQERREQAKKNLIDVRSRWTTMGARKAPAVFILIGATVVVFLLTKQQFRVPTTVVRHLMFRDPGDPMAQNPVVERSTDPFSDIRGGQIWRLVTPIFLHGGWLHFVFNMYWLYHLGGQIESRRGALFLLALTVLVAVLSNAAQAAVDGPNFGGMSGVNYGLFGFVWMKTRFDTGSGFFLPQSTIVILVVWFFLCMGNFFGPIANTAHGVGLAVGVVIGYAPVLLRDMTRR